MLFFSRFSYFYGVVRAKYRHRLLGMSIKAILGANIKYYRKKQRLSQEQLSEKLEISPKHLSTIETGATFISAELLEKLTQTLQISASALFYDVEETASDDTLLSLIDQIVEKELARTTEAIKNQIRHRTNS
jgi:transcriptional regulator with XRE-family HTH domain